MKPSSKNLFLHADGDSFFVACELTKRPELRGKAVIVGEDRGIAVAMSTEAKKLGVTRGMPVFKIKKLYPEVIILPHHFDLYRDISQKVYHIMLSYLEQVEVYSIDECFAVIKPSDIAYFGGAEKLARDMKDEIQKTLGVTYSFGVAQTKALAKLASKLQKPNGLVVLLSKEQEIEALQKTSIDDIWGLGRKTVPRLQTRGLKTAYDFVVYPHGEITKHFSEPLSVLQKELSGESLLEVHSDTDPREQQSIQSTSTFRPPSSDEKIIWSEIAENAEHACANARKLNLLSNKVSFFVKTTEFKYYAQEAKLPLYTSDSSTILNIVSPLLQKVLMTHEKIRSTGVVLHNLTREEEVPRDLFGKQEHAIQQLSIDKTMDKLRKKFGWDAIKRASSVKKKR
ncbi:MAG: DNA polymerase IV [bacterium]